MRCRSIQEFSDGTIFELSGIDLVGLVAPSIDRHDFSAHSPFAPALVPCTILLRGQPRLAAGAIA